MLEVIFWIVVGAFVGWHIPEPTWARVAKEKVLDVIKNLKAPK